MQIPDNVARGQYYITVWSDTYDAILEDTLAVNINPDDPTEIDNNNYKARPISVLGIDAARPGRDAGDGAAAATAGGALSRFSYTVQNQGDAFSGTLDRPRLDRPTTPTSPTATRQVAWSASTSSSARSATARATPSRRRCSSAPSVVGRYLVVETRPARYRYVAEIDESNNTKTVATRSTTGRPTCW